MIDARNHALFNGAVVVITFEYGETIVFTFFFILKEIFSIIIINK
jgi:hypothetical protein